MASASGDLHTFWLEGSAPRAHTRLQDVGSELFTDGKAWPDPVQGFFEDEHWGCLAVRSGLIQIQMQIADHAYESMENGQPVECGLGTSNTTR